MSRVQAQGFLRNYARYLGLDIELLVDEVAGEKGRSILSFRGSRPASPAEIISRETTDDAPLPSPSPAASRASSRASRRLRSRRRGTLGNIVIVLIAGAVVSGLVIGLTQLFDTLAEQENQPVLGPAAIPTVPSVTDSTPDPVASDSTLTETPSGIVQPAQPAAAGTHRRRLPGRSRS
jgi:cytoskeletal protein RodZ